MISDSCNCYGRTGHGCKGRSRSSRCPACDRNKVRRCQSEGLYQEGDPLKELNWCCDRGCDLLNHSSKCSQIKKIDIKMNEKKINCPNDNNLDGVDNRLACNRKHLCWLPEDDASCQLHNCNPDIPPEHNMNKYLKNKKCPEDNKPRPHKPQHENLQYRNSGDFHDTVSSNSKSLGNIEKEKTPSEVRERYIREMEILRSNLNILKDVVVSDGKRLRQRSESEPGFTELPGGVPKRARDNSPKTKRRLPANPANSQPIHRFPVKQNIPFHRESKSLSPSSLKNSDKNATLSKGKDITSLIESGEDHKGRTHDVDEQNKCDTDDDNDDEIGSSSDSNTPSKVGKTLGSITLNEIPKKELNNSFLKKYNSESVPQIEEKSQKNSSLDVKNLFRSSLFPNVPPYVKFFMHDVKGPTLPPEITKHLKWKLSSITPIVIRRTLINSGFKLVRSELSRDVKNVYTSYNPVRKPVLESLPCFPSQIVGNVEELFGYMASYRNEKVEQQVSMNARLRKKLLKESNEWTGQWGKHMKSIVFKTLKDFQKLNHFPGTFQIGRKDRLWKNLYRLMMRFGKKEFGFIPKTYILPHDRKLLRTAWEKSSGPGKGQWIVKPPAAARGTGIKVVHKWGQIPKKKSLIVQKYIAQPYLINGSKFDLRLYVLMTSIHPLRIYLYDDGLVRFASVKYSNDVECLSNRFMHLTNYSINKLSTQYQVNADASSCHGHKWSLKSLWTYFAKEGVNVKALRKNLTDLVIKTIISGESNINMLSKNNLPSRYCSYELFGIDVLLDCSLKPWLLEVNISPSLHSASPLDLAVKGPLVKELLNIAGFQIPAKLTKEQDEGFLDDCGIRDKTHTICYDKRLYYTNLSKEEKMKQENFVNLTRKEYLNSILEDLTPDDVRHLIQFEDELTQIKRFEKIFPTTSTHTYHQFFEGPRYYNMVLDAWETKYNKNRTEGVRLLESLCEKNLHLNVSFFGGKTKSSPSLSELSCQALPETEAESDFEPEKDLEEQKRETPKKCSTPTIRFSTRPKSSPKPAVVSKPTILTAHLINRKPKTPKSPALDDSIDPHIPLKETCFKVLAQIRENGLKFGTGDPDKLMQLPNCKLENSILSESLGSGKNVLSPSKHMHCACIKMNTSG